MTRQVRVLWVCLSGLILAALSEYLPSEARAARQGPPDLCRTAAARASQTTGVPLDVLMAISLTETGRKVDGEFAPWPWTLNIAGSGHWLQSENAALDKAYSTLSGGQRSFDVGCFQINYRWHGEHFASLEEMMDPVRNALYAAKFLSDLFAESGDWTIAAGHYHSRTPEYANRYRRIFEANLGRNPDFDSDFDVVAATARLNGFPLLQAANGPSAFGSLVPQTSGNGAFFANHNAQPLWPGS